MKRVDWMPAVLFTALVLAGSILFLTGCEDEVAAEVLGDNAAVAGTSAPAEPVSAVAGIAAGTSETSASGMSTEPAPAGQTVAVVMAIEDLVENASAYIGKSVAVQGTILAQCIQGCRFSIDDGTGVVNIELVDEALENVLMQGSVGRVVEVRGVVDTSSPPRILVEDRAGWTYVN